MMSGLSDDLNGISVLKLIFQRNDRPVHLGADARVAHIRVNAVSVIDRRCTLRESLHISGRREDIYLVGKKRQLQIFHEFPRIFQLVLKFEQFAQSLDLHFIAALQVASLLVTPVCSNSLFRPFMHLSGPDLNFHSFAVRPDDGRVERAIVVGFRHGDVVLESSRDRFPYCVNHAQRLVTFFFFVGIDNDSESHEVINFIEVDALLLHLFINAVEMLRPSLHLSLQSVFMDFPSYDVLDLFGISVSFFLSHVDPRCKICVGL